LEALFATILQHIPAPTYEEGAPLQAHVTNLDASPFLGRLALLRIHNGALRKGEVVARVKLDGSIHHVRITELLRTEALERVPAEEAHAGDIVAVAGIEDIMIGETLTDADDPRPLPPITVDEPAISMTIGVNTSPMAGREKKTKANASGTARCGCFPPTGLTRGRCRAEESSRSRSSWKRCGGKGLNSPSASPRWSPARLTGRSTNRWSVSPSTCRRSTWGQPPSCSPPARAGWRRWRTTVAA